VKVEAHAGMPKDGFSAIGIRVMLMGATSFGESGAGVVSSVMRVSGLCQHRILRGSDAAND
jgi:hypothetical protein